MPRLPTVTYAGDDDLTTGDYGTASSRSVLHPATRSHSPSTAAPSQRGEPGSPASPLTTASSPSGTPSPNTAHPSSTSTPALAHHHGSLLFNTSRAERPQLAHDYPQIAFTSKRELQHEMQTAANSVVRDANGRVVRRPNLFVFGVGSYGLRDNASPAVSSPLLREDGAEANRTALTTHASPTAAASQQAGLSTHGKKGRETAEKDGSAATRLPALARVPAAGATGGQAASPTASVATSATVPFTPRALRCGGVIDTFSYFSVHRVHPELYSK